MPREGGGTSRSPLITPYSPERMPLNTWGTGRSGASKLLTAPRGEASSPCKIRNRGLTRRLALLYSMHIIDDLSRGFRREALSRRRRGRGCLWIAGLRRRIRRRDRHRGFPRGFSSNKGPSSLTIEAPESEGTVAGPFSRASFWRCGGLDRDASTLPEDSGKGYIALRNLSIYGKIFSNSMPYFRGTAQGDHYEEKRRCSQGTCSRSCSRRRPSESRGKEYQKCSHEWYPRRRGRN